MAAPLPLRPAWRRTEEQLRLQVHRPGKQGAYARAMLALVPPLMTYLSKERDGDGPEHSYIRKPIDTDVVNALTLTLGKMLVNTIREGVRNDQQLYVLDQVLNSIRRQGVRNFAMKHAVREYWSDDRVS